MSKADNENAITSQPERAEDSVIREKLEMLFEAYESGHLRSSDAIHGAEYILDIAYDCGEARFFLFYGKASFFEDDIFLRLSNSFMTYEERPEARYLQDIMSDMCCKRDGGKVLEYYRSKYYLKDKDYVLSLMITEFYAFMKRFYAAEMRSLCYRYRRISEKEHNKQLREFFIDMSKRIQIFSGIVHNNDYAQKNDFINNTIFVNNIVLATRPNRSQDLGLEISYEANANFLRAEIGAAKEQPNYRVHIHCCDPQKCVRGIYNEGECIAYAVDQTGIIVSVFDRIMNFFSKKKERQEQPPALSCTEKIETDKDQQPLDSYGRDECDILLTKAHTALKNPDDTDMKSILGKIIQTKRMLRNAMGNGDKYDLFVQTRLFTYMEPYLNHIIRNEGVLDDKYRPTFLESFKMQNELLEAKLQNIKKTASVQEEVAFDVMNSELKQALVVEKGKQE